jgi:hypothetical protein
MKTNTEQIPDPNGLFPLSGSVTLKLTLADGEEYTGTSTFTSYCISDSPSTAMIGIIQAMKNLASNVVSTDELMQKLTAEHFATPVPSSLAAWFETSHLNRRAA